jgi:uncharacterized coiled-coil protein SlyX
MRDLRTLEKRVSALKKEVKKLTDVVTTMAGDTYSVFDYLTELDKTLNEQNEWLSKLADILTEDDEEYKKEHEEFMKKIQPFYKGEKVNGAVEKKKKRHT